VQLHELLDQRQADAEPPRRVLRALLGLREHLEDAVELRGRDPDAVVVDRQACLVAVARELDAHAAAGIRELARVVEQVAEHLCEALAVPVQDEGAGYRALRK
jgi:hypothetical protein